MHYFQAVHNQEAVRMYYIIIVNENIVKLTLITFLAEEGGGFQNGMNYQRLEEECWQSEPNLASEIRRNTRESGQNQAQQSAESGFRREKKIFDDDNDEHVLYFQ